MQTQYTQCWLLLSICPWMTGLIVATRYMATLPPRYLAAPLSCYCGRNIYVCCCCYCHCHRCVIYALRCCPAIAEETFMFAIAVIAIVTSVWCACCAAVPLSQKKHLFLAVLPRGTQYLLSVNLLATCYLLPATCHLLPSLERVDISLVMFYAHQCLPVPYFDKIRPVTLCLWLLHTHQRLLCMLCFLASIAYDFPCYTGCCHPVTHY